MTFRGHCCGCYLLHDYRGRRQVICRIPPPPPNFLKGWFFYVEKLLRLTECPRATAVHINNSHSSTPRSPFPAAFSCRKRVTKRCRLFWLHNSALVYEPKCWGGGELRGLGQWVQRYTGAQINFGDLTPYLTCVSYKGPFLILSLAILLASSKYSFPYDYKVPDFRVHIFLRSDPDCASEFY